MNVKLLYNGNIYTGDVRHPWAETLAINDGQVVALDAQARAWAELPTAEALDLHGATLIPGLIDAHIHLMWYALSLGEVALRGLSRDVFLAAIAEQASMLPPGVWIKGRGWDQNVWEDSRFPTAAELDRVAPQHPVALIAKNAHALVANSVALECAGIKGDTPDLPQGKIGRDADGHPDGMFFEHAMSLVLDAMPDPTLEDAVVAIDAAQERLLSAGLTGVHDVDGHPAFAALQELRRMESLRLRVVKYVRLAALEGALSAGLRSGFGDDWLRFGGLKLFADGALGSRTAALLEPYADEPRNSGLLTMTPERLLSVSRQAAEGGLALAIHAIGDRANRLVLDVLETVCPLNPQLRHRIEHVQLLDLQDLPRLARAGIVASMQPVHAAHDVLMAERYWGARTANAYTWRSLLDAGTVLAFGADSPIEPFDPFLGMYAAVTRRGEDAPDSDSWHPEQCLTLPEALRAYTWGAAYAAGLEDHLGLLVPGYQADLLVLDRNIFALPPEALLETKVQRVMVGGVWRWQREQ